MNCLAVLSQCRPSIPNSSLPFTIHKTPAKGLTGIQGRTEIVVMDPEISLYLRCMSPETMADDQMNAMHHRAAVMNIKHTKIGGCVELIGNPLGSGLRICVPLQAAHKDRILPFAILVALPEVVLFSDDLPRIVDDRIVRHLGSRRQCKWKAGL